MPRPSPWLRDRLDVLKERSAMGKLARPTDPATAGPVRRLFLDDDPLRAEEFLAEYPDAVWVETVADCLAELDSGWDVVYLDHDLGGEQFVDAGRADCGMEVVRWLAFEPRPHLRRTRFFVHSHNGVAAYVMVLQLKGLGLNASASPFGEGLWRRPLPPPPPLWKRALAWVRNIRRLRAIPEPKVQDSGP
jgi:hypothetical protein